MSKKNGFTLVELMVVIVIIGVLAAVAIPRLMAAADRARASEGPQILGSIARLQHVYNVEGPGFYQVAGNVVADWVRLGMDGTPHTRNFEFYVISPAPNAVFTAVAVPLMKLGNVNTATDAFWVNNEDIKGVTSENMRSLVRSFVGDVCLTATKPAKP